MKLLLNLVTSILNLMVHNARKKKRRAPVAPWIERMFGYPFWLWFNLKFYPGRVPEEMEVFIKREETLPATEHHKYFLSSSGLWVPAVRS